MAVPPVLTLAVSLTPGTPKSQFELPNQSAAPLGSQLVYCWPETQRDQQQSERQTAKRRQPTPIVCRVRIADARTVATPAPSLPATRTTSSDELVIAIASCAYG